MTAATVIKNCYGNKRIVAPDSKDALAKLDSIDIILRDTVIWLDDINFLIGAGGITGSAVRRLAADGNIVIATIRARVYDQYLPSSEVQSPEWDTLKVFERVFLSKELSETEKELIASAVNDEVVKDRILSVGLGEYVGAAQLIDENLRLGPSVSPVGYAIIRGAADWRRSGINRPVPSALLPSLAVSYLNENKRYEINVSHIYAAALEWATHEINEEVSLLQQTGSDSFAVFDYALDLLSAEAEELANDIWPVVIDAATPAELLNIGYTAWVSYGVVQIGLEAWTRAAESGVPGVAPKAMYNIAHMFRLEDRPEEAEAMYGRAVNSDDRIIAALAESDLGYLKFRQGEKNKARDLYKNVLANYDDEYARELTHLRLGKVAEAEEDAREAYEWYDLVLRSGFYNLVPQAEIGLAHTDLLDDRVQQARGHFLKAINSGHKIYSPMAAYELAILLLRFGQDEDARSYLRISLDTWNDAISPIAAVALGQLLKHANETEAATKVYRIARESGHARAVPAAAVLLGEILEREGKIEEALKLYEEAATCGIEEIVREAMANVTRLRRERPGGSGT